MFLRYINLRMDVKGNKQRLQGDARKVFFDRLRWFKKVYLFAHMPSDDEYAVLSDVKLVEGESLHRALPNAKLRFLLIDWFYQNCETFCPPQPSD